LGRSGTRDHQPDDDGDHERPHRASLPPHGMRVDRRATICCGVASDERNEMELCSRIDEARRSWDVLRHPFYTRWERGELRREELAFYAGEYRHAVAALARAADAAGDVEHAREEAEHLSLWDDFAAALDAPLDRDPTAETEACADAWRTGGCATESSERRKRWRQSGWSGSARWAAESRAGFLTRATSSSSGTEIPPRPSRSPRPALSRRRARPTWPGAWRSRSRW